jgi:DNA-binding transcriptional MerR regulator
MATASDLDRFRDVELTLEELAVTAARLLRRLEVRPGDGRIAPAPDPRSVRYYQTIGVVDRPARYEGRRAVYGFRHLLQLLAVKQFQQEGHPLHLIQQSLAGCPTTVLEEALANVLSGLGETPRPHAAAARPSRPDVAASRASGQATQRVATSPSAPPPDALKAAPAPQPTAPAGLIAARVAPGITVTIDPALIDDPDAVLRRMAAALAAKEP